MKKEIHPEYFVTSVKCGCGNSFTTAAYAAGIEGRYLQCLPSVLYR